MKYLVIFCVMGCGSLRIISKTTFKGKENGISQSHREKEDQQ